MKRLVLLVSAALVAGCAALMGLTGHADEARAFLDAVDSRLRVLSQESAKAAWVQATHITEDTQFLAAKASERRLEYLSSAAREARRFDRNQLDAQAARALMLLERKSAVPADSELLSELTRLSSRLEALYGSGRYCPPGVEPGASQCRRLGELEEVLASSTDPAELQEAWEGWHGISPPMRDDYARFVELQNIGARELGYADAGAYWRAGYDMPPDEFEQVVEGLWQEVRPLYQSLHCFVRAELVQEYGDELVPADGPIPAHLLGNMWAQQWSEIYPRLTPYPGQPPLDVNSGLKRQGYDAVKMVRQAEGFYRSIGFPALPESFYRHSMFVQPAGREAVCHASAWDIDLRGDVRIKMCIQPNEEDLRTIYHELGHIYYYLAYNALPVLFQRGAHDGFHEAVGDTVMLSLMTPAYLASIGLVDRASSAPEAVINQQLKMAMDKVAFLPFGLLVDKWRWQVFSGEVPPERYNAAWWELKRRYQGVAPPRARPAEAFDPGAKYHIPGDTPYMRYFLAHIMQFQFYAAMCDAAGHAGPLHECNFAGSEAAGERMWATLQAGQSQPWPQTMQILTGGREMDARPLLRYFAPLREWLDAQNQGRACGW